MHSSFGMRSGRLACWLVTSLLAMPLDRADAQQRRPVSLDVTLGINNSATDGQVKDRTTAGVAADLTLAIRVDRSRHGLVAGVSAGVYGPVAFNDMCVPAPDGGCLPNYPAFALLAALVGWESSRGVVRGMAGLGYADGEKSHSALGLQSRLDVALPVFRHLALIGSLRATVIPNYLGATYGIGAIGLGLRFRTG